MNKFNSKTGLIAAVLVGMTMSYTPVQAVWSTDEVKKAVGVVWSETKKVPNVVYKWVKWGANVGLVVAGSTLVGSALDPVNTFEIYNDGTFFNGTFFNNLLLFNSGKSFKGAALGFGLSVLMLSSLYLYKQEFKSEKKDKDKDNDKD